MKSGRSFLLAAAATAFLVTACSQPGDSQKPSLEAQFGTTGNDAATAISVAPNGIVTKAISFTFGPFEEDGRPPYIRTRLLVRQLDSSAKLLREIDVGTFECAGDSYDCHDPKIAEVKTDNKGSTYALQTFSSSALTDIPREVAVLFKYSSTGQAPLWKKTSSEIHSTGGFDLDTNGNIYMAQTNYDPDSGDPTLSYFTRYNTNGVKWYQRNSQVGIIQDIDVAPNGDIYIIGDKGLSRYSNGGGLIWTKAIPGSELASSGNSLFILSQDASGNTRISKRTATGAQVWTTVVGSDGVSFASGLTADTKGNSYYNAFAPDVEPASVNKLDINGKRAWSTVLQFDYDRPGARALASYDGTSVYAVGSTDGPVNGADRGGEDAFIVRLNAQGQKVWER